ncbi:molybdopterin-dependent oxidoreductase [Rhodovibrionaceae bacterium A322]
MAPNQSLFRKTLSVASAAVLIIALSTTTALAEQLPTPTGKVLLTVSGNIEHTNGDGVASFDREMLMALGSHSLTVETPWTEGANTFKGPLVKDLLSRVGARGKTIMATAINDYQTEIPVEDAQTYNIILAMEHNGKVLTVRNRGPLWVIFPWSEHSELQTEMYYARSIWQLKSLSIDD